MPGRYNPGTDQNWRGLVQPYLKSIQIFACPSNTGNSMGTWPKFDIPRSYVCNGLNLDGSAVTPKSADSMGGSAPMPDLGGVSIASMNDVARTLIVTESDPGWQWPEAVTNENPQPFADNMFSGHLGTVNFLFADGHVKSLKPTATGSPTNMWNIEENNDAFPALMDKLNAWQVKVNKG